ncbi:MAG: hypothetical protein IJR99_10715 [Kiritimatiellae bacterium]|nr:hypothetical protein [Kiritimatiellia bacterium]
MNWTRLSCFATFCFALSVRAGQPQFSGPENWTMIQTNAIAAWQQSQAALPDCKVWKGVVADGKKKEVRLLAEAVGHSIGITTEFAIVGPLSDRAYETATVSVAMPSDVARAMESLGLPRGKCNATSRFHFWPVGEHVALSYRRIEAKDAKSEPIASLFEDKETESPMLGNDGLVFTGGNWLAGGCQTDTNMPSSIVSLYNASDTIFDVPSRVNQTDVYGRLTLAKRLRRGELVEFTFRPLLANGKLRVLPLTVSVLPSAEGLAAQVTGDRTGTIGEKLSLQDLIRNLQRVVKEGMEPFITLDFAQDLTVQQATEVATVFQMLDGKGVKMIGKAANGLYFQAFLPESKWRERKDRVPQPFELHLTRTADRTLRKVLTFIEEDWSGESLDPELKPHDYEFKEWDELLPLVVKSGGKDNKVELLFVFAPKDLPLRDLLPGVIAVDSRLRTVYVFGE